jgi:hypothetical protein
MPATGHDGVLSDTGGEGNKEITIFFPLYNGVTDLRIGLKEGSTFLAASPYQTGKRVLFYGSSITQGGCVSRPSMAYPNQLSRMLDCDIINLGFSGSAKGEREMLDYIIGLDFDVFVLDYDHNAPDPDHLRATHESFFRGFRAARPDVPVIMLSAPDVRFKDASWKERRDIVKATYENAVRDGDKNVYFIDGETLFGEEDWHICTVDSCHPNDLGHYRMAKRVLPVLQKLL